uniref:Uncharacterized protein n=1 Tax=Monopterus albus TaxID=43700 RepID=A0A3Q3KGI5_MONAL
MFLQGKEEPEYQTPPTCDLLSLLLKNRRPTGAVNRVWPNLYIGNDKTLLVNLGITHIVNTEDGPQHIDTGPHFYKDTNILYHGVEAADCKDFDLSPFFLLRRKVLVHCAQGITVHRHRNILPNVGFLNQLCHLDSSLAL